MDIQQLIDRLEETIDRGWRLPLSSRVAIDEDAFLNIIDQMRITIPKEIKQAREVQFEKDKYIAQAREEARRIVAQAREDAARQLDDHQLRQAAQAQADSFTRRAKEEAMRTRGDADDYAETRLRELGQYVGQLQRIIQNGLDSLDERRAQVREEADQLAQNPRDESS